jgi:hypothetical protein
MGAGFNAHKQQKPCENDEKWLQANLVPVGGRMLWKGFVHLSQQEQRLLLSKTGKKNDN